MKCYNFCRSRLELRVIYSNYPNLTTKTVNWHYGGLCSAYGLAEGSVNKIKLTKRIMYVRNSFELLKAKLLLNEIQIN